MTEQMQFKPEDVKKARFLFEYVHETEATIKNLEIPQKTYEYEKLVFLRRLLDNPRCSRKRRDEIDEMKARGKEELDSLKDKSRTLNNELDIFKKMFEALPEELQSIAQKSSAT